MFLDILHPSHHLFGDNSAKLKRSGKRQTWERQEREACKIPKWGVAEVFSD